MRRPGRHPFLFIALRASFFYSSRSFGKWPADYLLPLALEGRLKAAPAQTAHRNDDFTVWQHPLIGRMTSPLGNTPIFRDKVYKFVPL